MIKIRVPATSANLGPGFDVLGLALNVYNTFSFERSNTFLFENIEEKYANEDNLFIQAYKKTFEKDVKPIKLRFDTCIPISRGLGSSAALIVGGITAGYIIQERPFDIEEMLSLATEMEGHPDNVAPALLGGLTACLKETKLFTEQIPVHDSLCFTILIPDSAVATEEARKILPQEISLNNAVYSSSHLLFLTKALKDGDIELLKYTSKDILHEPYRKTLIPHFTEVKDIVLKDQDGTFLISGSGSTCIFIGTSYIYEETCKKIDVITNNTWKIQHVTVSKNGVEREDDGIWHPII